MGTSHAARARTITAAADAEGERRHSQVLNQDLFTSVLIAERKRADRSSQPLGLLIVRVEDLPAAGTSTLWTAAIVAVLGVVRRSDTAGWFEWPAAIGVILPELRSTAPVNPPELEARIRHELEKWLPRDTVRRFSIRCHLHSSPDQQRDGRAPIDLLLFPELDWYSGRQTVSDAIKRGLDVIGSLMLLIVLAPLFLLIAILLKARRPEPVFVKQPRIGRRMKPFSMLKFRSGEPTSVGRVLRDTSLDELPQLWNVLCGDMSLVGPRPAVPDELVMYKPWHCRRILEAKPGITGPWQLWQRRHANLTSASLDEMTRFDLRYARQRSLWTDIKILLATPAAVSSKRAY